MRGLLFGGFKAIQDELGEEALVLDVVNQTISVSGNDQDVASVKRRLALISPAGPSHVVSIHQGEGEGTCPVCFCEATNGIKLPCGHAYDTECLRLLVQTSTTSLQCIREMVDSHTQCAIKIPLSVVRELLRPNEEAQLFESYMRSHINSRPEEFHYCPSPDCPTVYRPARAGTIVHCPTCLERICAHCHIEHHEGLSCAEYKDGMSENSVMFQRWKKENGVKACPKCSTDIQKNGGCNHIKCARCKIHICWACMTTFNDEDSNGGVYAHMRQTHGRIA
ncbi:hypothetical protein OF83DRAFT_1070958 [Amylostereum chailletii]|nr:hypothetical protein OF83DRAFT_1070958 [Amylostereum chailletii]